MSTPPPLPMATPPRRAAVARARVGAAAPPAAGAAGPRPVAEARPGAAAGPGPAAAPAVTPAVAPPAAPAGRRARPVAVLALQARALQHARLDAAASAVVDELARLLPCDRVSLGLVQPGLADQPGVRVVAISHTTEVDVKQPLPRLIAAAMAECVHQRSPIIHPLPPGAGLMMDRGHTRLAAHNGRMAIYSLPLLDLRSAAGGLPPVFGALLLERQAGMDPATLAAAQDVATFVGPVLALQHRLDQPISGRLVDAVTPRHGGPGGLSKTQLLLLAAALATLVLALWPGTWRVVAPARVEGLGQQVLAAPMDGFIAAAALQPGAVVKAGQVLLSLQDHDLKLEQARWTAEVDQLDKKYREAQTTDDATQIVLARGRLAQAQAQLDLTRHQLSRTQLRAPFDGVLLSGDHTQAQGAPVKRGDTLLTVAPDRQWRIVAEVDEQDIAAVQTQQSAQVLFAALDGPPLPLRITRVAPLATVADGRNLFEVEGRLAPGADPGGAAAGLRPGQRGVVRIDIGPRLQGWIWWHRATLWARSLWWRLSG